MRYLLIVKATEYSEAGLVEEKDYREAFKEYKKSLAKNGVFLADEDLQTSATGLRIMYTNKDEKPKLLAGPFPINQDLINGFILIDVNSEEEALNWALQMPVPHVGGKFEIELRRLKEQPFSVQDSGIKSMEAVLQDQLTMLKNL
ncbi:YciI family protein [Bacillus sp. JCM 19034]|uniref:YciI family protein n=1 Tax=Bacillus sp. JCM 19034 TaxID=1481928 RepID=UPI000783E076|nr:YciI family protein [Bacillus sp. JCM 19034]